MARERYNAVWRAGAGGEVWWTNLTFNDFVAKGDDLFNTGWRMTDLETNGGITGVWHPATDAQVVLVGIDRAQFEREVADRFDQGLRIVSLRVRDGSYAVVWRSGSGPQEVHAFSTGDALLAADGPFFARGLRIQTLQQDFGHNVYWGVWRGDLGTGGQWAKTGMNAAQFQAEDATQTAAGNRLTQITSINGITGIWRTGSDAQTWVLEDGPVDFTTRRTQNFNAGLRMVSLSVGFV